VPQSINLRAKGPKVLSQMKEPYFETQSDLETGIPTRNIMAVEGGKAVFVCTVRNLGENNTVSHLKNNCFFSMSS